MQATIRCIRDSALVTDGIPIVVLANMKDAAVSLHLPPWMIFLEFEHQQEAKLLVALCMPTTRTRCGTFTFAFHFHRKVAKKVGFVHPRGDGCIPHSGRLIFPTECETASLCTDRRG